MQQCQIQSAAGRVGWTRKYAANSIGFLILWAWAGSPVSPMDSVKDRPGRGYPKMNKMGWESGNPAANFVEAENHCQKGESVE